jgi:hypothetical protein
LTVPAVPDGTVKLYRGNAGSPIQEVLSIDNADNVVVPKLTPPEATLQTQSVIGSQLFGFRNVLINSAMQVDQRANGVSVALTTSLAYGSVDRFAAFQAGTANGFIQQAAGGPSGFRKHVQVGRNTSSVTTGMVAIVQVVETANSTPFMGQGTSTPTATFSFWAKAGANFSASGNNIQVLIGTGTGTDQSTSIGGWTGFLQPVNVVQTITTSWQKYIFTTTLSSTVNQIGVQLSYTPTGTAGADDKLYTTGWQLETGSLSTPFEQRPYSLELSLCQRYYYQSNAAGIASQVGVWTWKAVSTTVAWGGRNYPVTMRVTPTVTLYSIAGGVNGASIAENGSSPGVTNTVNNPTKDGIQEIACTPAAWTINQAIIANVVAIAEL